MKRSLIALCFLLVSSAYAASDILSSQEVNEWEIVSDGEHMDYYRNLIRIVRYSEFKDCTVNESEASQKYLNVIKDQTHKILNLGFARNAGVTIDPTYGEIDRRDYLMKNKKRPVWRLYIKNDYWMKDELVSAIVDFELDELESHLKKMTVSVGPRVLPKKNAYGKIIGEIKFPYSGGTSNDFSCLGF